MFDALQRSPTKPEKLLNDIIKKHNLPFKFVGDGKFMIHGFIPDFVECKGRKLVIEVFGDYWHNPKERKIKYNYTEEGRKFIYSKYGYKTLVVWEHELVKNKYGAKLSKEQIVDKIKEFSGS